MSNDKAERRRGGLDAPWTYGTKRGRAVVSDAFNSEDCELMSRALSGARAELERRQAYDGLDEEEIKSILTKAIMEAVGRGERDPKALTAHALSQFVQARRSTLR